MQAFLDDAFTLNPVPRSERRLSDPLDPRYYPRANLPSLRADQGHWVRFFRDGWIGHRPTERSRAISTEPELGSFRQEAPGDSSHGLASFRQGFGRLGSFRWSIEVPSSIDAS